ncbi:hypothetical protein EWH46_08475 [Sphaerotilus sulfidivorans]|uniref:Aldo/keto reductase n=1 Tax=Sphaerotilus sulfidivorans TaxID=639200 RepID=A0A5C1PZE8_9BURK|nr:hypothetical protein EWH46_08475 [Sphaerotilus sulfidivorans]
MTSAAPLAHSPFLAAGPLRRLGPAEVAPIGLGCMNLSHAYGDPPGQRGRRALQRCHPDRDRHGRVSGLKPQR